MYYIFEYKTTHSVGYIFTTTEWFSSNFDSLEQLCEVGLDDPLKEIMYGSPRIDRDFLYHDCKFLFQTTSLETAHIDFPEWFV